MPDDPKTSRTLSEIGHLFLSSIREKQMGGAPVPRRVPPRPQAEPQAANPEPPAPREVDLTPEEIAQVFGLTDSPGPSGQLAAAADNNNGDNQDKQQRIPPISAVIASHLAGSPLDHARQYARHLASKGQRVGLMQVDGSEFRLLCFDCTPHGGVAEDQATCDYFDAREMASSIDELSWDLDRWLLLVPSARAAESRALLREVSHWVMLSTCDHDGVIATYRTLKGLSDTVQPRLSLALLDAADEDAAHKIHVKLASVCQQFLAWELEEEAPVRPVAAGVAEHLVICCRSTRSKAELANAPQWRVAASFLARAKAQQASQSSAAAVAEPARLPPDEAPVSDANAAKPAAPATKLPVDGRRAAAATTGAVGKQAMNLKMTDMTRNAMPQTAAAAPAPTATTTTPMPPMTTITPITPEPQPESPAATAPVAAAPVYPRAADPLPVEGAAGQDAAEVIDLPDAAAGAPAILAAVLRGSGGGLIECPLVPPMCPEARLAVTRDRRLTLLAVARQGLAELRAIGLAYRWLIENQSLIAMAVPQMSISTDTAPHLRLLVDHADLTAEILQPMLQSDAVTVQAYRRLRWAGRTGLLLEAA